MTPSAMTPSATTVGLVSAGHMGSGLGWALRTGGHRVVTTMAGRSARTARLAETAGLATVADLDVLVSTADIVLVVTPPGAAVNAAASLSEACRRAKAHPLVADLNAVSPSTMEQIATTLAAADLDCVDGAISGSPPTVRPGAAIYLSGSRAAEVAQLNWRGANPVLVAGPVGAASAVKMCTASVYKGLVGLFAQAMRTGAHHGVLNHVLADLAEDGHQPAAQVAVAATKAARFVPEMLEIARTQAAAGLPAGLFEAFAEVYRGLAATELAQADPESVDRTISADSVIARLATPTGQ